MTTAAVTPAKRQEHTSPLLDAMHNLWSNQPVEFGADDDQIRGIFTKAVAEAILTVPTGTGVGEFVKAAGGWTQETYWVATQQHGDDSAAYLAALGAHEDATLTRDGDKAITGAWCDCPDPAFSLPWVGFEEWSADGREVTGYVCGKCRRLVERSCPDCKAPATQSCHSSCPSRNEPV